MVTNLHSAFLVVSNGSAKKALSKVKCQEDLEKLEKKWKFIFSEKQGILIFDSPQRREKFIEYYRKTR